MAPGGNSTGVGQSLNYWLLRHRLKLPSRLVCAAVLFTGAARPAVLLELHFSVLENALARQAFTVEGRRYVKGSKDTKCSFAYLANPKIGSSNGQITVKTRFSGRSAVDVFNRCIGLGDEFDVTIYATPFYKRGNLALKDVTVSTSGKDSLYIRRVRQALAESIGKDFSYPLEQAARAILEEQRPGVEHRRSMSDFAVYRVTITEQALVLTLDFRLSVK